MEITYRLLNYAGTLLWKDIPIVDFAIVGGRCTRWELHSENERYYPIALTYDPTYKGLVTMLRDRLLPKTRQLIDRVFQDLDVDCYNWDAILLSNHGLSTDDCYWFCDIDHDLTYADVKIRD